MQTSKIRNDKQLMQLGAHNRLKLISLIDEFIKRDEEIQRSNRRTKEKDRRLQMDKLVFDQHMKRIEREKQSNTMALSNRFMEMEKRKKDGIESANRRWKQMQKEEKERKNSLTMRVENAKKQREKVFEKLRGDSLDRHKHDIDYAISKSAAAKRQLQRQEEKYQSEIDTMKTHANYFERLRQKARLGAQQTAQSIEKRRQQKLHESFRKFREQEQLYEQETMTLVARINELEKMKARQRELLRQRNEKFRTDLERRKQITMAKIKSELNWKQEYVANLKSKITEMAKKRDYALSESMETLAVEQLATQTKERQMFLRKQHAIEGERKVMQEQMQLRIDEMCMKKEHDTDKVIDAIHNLEKKKKKMMQQQQKERIPNKEVTKPELKHEDDFAQTERAKTMLRFEEEAKEREQIRIKNEFQKLMRGFGTKSVTFAQ